MYPCKEKVQIIIKEVSLIIITVHSQLQIECVHHFFDNVTHDCMTWEYTPLSDSYIYIRETKI